MSTEQSHDVGSQLTPGEKRMLQSGAVQELSSGPKTYGELKEGGHYISTEQRLLVEKIDVSASSGGTTTGDFTNIYYLYGDERSAVKRFIEVNQDVIDGLDLESKTNPVGMSLDEYMYRVFLEQVQLATYLEGDQ